MSAMKHATVGSPYRVPPEPRRMSAILLAVAMHAVLLAFLWVGISWQNNKPVAVEAEVWDMKIQTAAPPPPPPVQAPEPEPEPEPAPAPKVIEPPAPPAPAPDIKLEQEKKRKEELRQQQLAEEKKAREEEKAKELAEKKEAEKKAKEEAAKKEAEAEKKEAEKQEKAEKLAKEKADKAAKAKAEAAAKAQKAAVRNQEMQRMLAQAGNGTSGTAAKATAPRLDSGYVAAITAKIKSMTNYANTDVPGNPTAVFDVDQLPTGEILSVKLAKSSGIPEFDEAVKRGIFKSSPLPKKKDGTVDRSLEVSFRMKDLK